MNNKNKKQRIIAAAEEIISEKGLFDATISEIARKAEVADSVIYQFFKGKEDLLFSIPGERMKDVLFLLEEQLEGIKDAESRLRKMILFHLKYNDTHRGYARILLLECRSSKNFYSSPAYQLIRSYSGILLDILKQGIKDGIFHFDLNVRLLRDIILGTMDWETIGCLASGETEETASDLEDIMALIHPMITCKNIPAGSISNRIMLAAEKIFSEKGFKDAKVSEIAKLARVAEGTVYEYFKNKEDLLLSIPANRFEQNIKNLSETFQIKNPRRKLRRFIDYHFTHFLKERDFLKIFLLQIQLNKRFYGSKAFDTFKNYCKVIEDVIEEGKMKGVFNSSVNARIFRNLFFGTFSHMALRWLIIENDNESDKMIEIAQIKDFLTAAVMKDDL